MRNTPWLLLAGLVAVLAWLQPVQAQASPGSPVNDCDPVAPGEQHGTVIAQVPGFWPTCVQAGYPVISIACGSDGCNGGEPGSGADPAAITLTLSRSGTVAVATVVAYTVSGTAAASDFGPLTGTVRIEPGEASLDLVITPLADYNDEGATPETVVVTLADGADDTCAPMTPGDGSDCYDLLEGFSSATATIADTDPVPVTFEIAAASRSESDLTATTVTVKRTGTAGVLQVPIQIGGTATLGTDYSTNLGGTGANRCVSIADAASQATFTFTLINDNANEGAETITVAGLPLAQQGGANDACTAHMPGVVPAAGVLLTIVDDDLQRVGVVATDNTARESLASTCPCPQASALLTFTRTEVNGALATAGVLTVNLVVTGSAEEGVDFATLPATIAFPEGASSVTLEITALDDAVKEVNENLRVAIGTGQYTILTSASYAEVTILDNDQPVITIAASDSGAREAPASEVANGGSVTITRSDGDLSLPLSVSMQLGGTATAGVDYTTTPASTSTITFAANVDAVTIAFAILDDGAYEGLEEISVRVLPSPNYGINPPSLVTVFIIDDESPDADTDGDGVPNTQDNCPDNVNVDQLDTDDDGVGDVCDVEPTINPDRDGDGVANASDNCPDNANALQADVDNDGIGDICDPVNNLATTDSDGDGLSDADEARYHTDKFDPDTDNDGLTDGYEVANSRADLLLDPLNSDSDGDGISDKLEVEQAQEPTTGSGEQPYEAALKSPVLYAGAGLALTVLTLVLVGLFRS